MEHGPDGRRDPATRDFGDIPMHIRATARPPNVRKVRQHMAIHACVPAADHAIKPAGKILVEMAAQADRTDALRSQDPMRF
jgi:hypothetical protein